mmetsp:Transcript_24447/g.67967  ORF Transcript_24447/g.67967 Transcript_24447/m.67967 type:complete len:226 (+) Transcript_24447:1123-1800(+)
MLAVNETDVCGGPFRGSNERALMASRTIPIQYEHFYFVVPLELKGTDSIADSFTNPFLPFSWGAWAAWLAVLCWVIAVFQWLEIGPRWKATVAQHSGSNSTTTTSSFDSCHEKPSQPTTWTEKGVQWVAFRLQLSAEALDILGERLLLPMTVTGKVVSVTLSLFLITMVASYTANLAAVLSGRTLTSALRSLGDAILQGERVCIPVLVAQPIRSTYPGLKEVRTM